VGNLIFRGFVIGIVAGLLAFGWARTFGEPPVNEAIGFESEQNEAKAAAAIAAGKKPLPEDPEIFSRNVQGGIGLLTGLVAVGAGLGASFAVMFAFANGRIGQLRPGATSVAVAGYLLVLAICFWILPGINEVPAEFPAVTLWNFRVASLGIQTVLWGSIGVLFGCLSEWSLAADKGR